MRGTVAKRLRRAIYGADLSSRARNYVRIEGNSMTILNHPASPRARYQRAKALAK